MKSRTATISFEQFKSELIAKHGEKSVRFDEHGKHGWTSLEMIPEKLVHGTPGPHWCDASTVPRSTYLLGSYNFVTNTAQFFER
jgi:hypothetical protein